MFNRLLIFLIIPLAFVFLPCVVFAEENLRDILSGKEGCDRVVCDDICALIKNNLKRGVDAKAVIRTSIQIGHSVCQVIRCAIDGGGELRLIIAGAVEAGSTPDVVSRCSVDAGAKTGAVAQILKSLGESPPGEVLVTVPVEELVPPGEELVPVDSVPTGPPGGRVISPSSF